MTNPTPPTMAQDQAVEAVALEDLALRRALSSALRFAGSRSCITAAEEAAILAAFDRAAIPTPPPAGMDSNGLHCFACGENFPTQCACEHPSVSMKNIRAALQSSPPPPSNDHAGLIEHVKYIAACIEAHADKFPVPSHMRKHVEFLRTDALLAPSHASPREGWQDIATAPKDGTQVLVGCTKYLHWTGNKPERLHAAWWDKTEDRWQVEGAIWQPTDWMPLPSPPMLARTALGEGQ